MKEGNTTSKESGASQDAADGGFERAPWFGKFSNWLSGRGTEFTLEAESEADVVRFVDRGNEGILGWIAVAIAIPPLALFMPVFLHDPTQPPGYRLDCMSYFLLALSLASAYRAVRGLARRSCLQVDRATEQLDWVETWPTPRRFSVPLTESHWIIQPVLLTYSRALPWKGYLLRVDVKRNSFVIAAHKDPRELKWAIPSDLRPLIQVKFIRDVARGTNPM